MKFWTCLGLVSSLLLASGCSRDFILEGERLPVRAAFVERTLDAPVSRAQPIALPAMVTNTEWTHRLGSPSTRIAHPALGSALQPVWSVSIGQGDGRRHRITAEPVTAGGVIYTLDSRARVSAVSTSGEIVWTRDLTPAFARSPDAASGGGLAIGDGKLFVTSAFGMLWALDLRTGAEIWSRRFDAGLSGAPTVAGPHVYVVANDSTAWAIFAATGQADWQLAGAPSPSSMMGGAAPAVTGDLVLFPTPAAELIAARRDTGQIMWRRAVAGTRVGIASAVVTDVTGDPVVQGDVVFVGNQSGRVMALQRSTGTPLWTANEAAHGPVWPVGGSVFLMSDRNRLLRLDAATGALVWATPLPLFTTARERRRAEIYPHYGPTLAGGRLIVGSSDGVLRSFDPVSGALLGETELRSGAASSPIVAGGTLFVVSRDGRLTAYR
ncbi:MAG: outer membrane protein assembly factor BamB family protein [Roseinatronobacter sp.]